MLSKNKHILWRESCLQILAGAGEEGRSAVDYIRSHGIKIGFKKTSHSAAACWTLSKRIYINSCHYSLDTPLSDPYLLCLLVHEVKHLQQGSIKALSVYGELEAWQAGYRFYYRLCGYYPNKVITEIMSLPLDWDRVILHRARGLMKLYAGKGYRVDLLPLYPIFREIRYLFVGK